MTLRRYGASHGVGLLHRLPGLEGTYAVALTAPGAHLQQLWDATFGLRDARRETEAGPGGRASPVLEMPGPAASPRTSRGRFPSGGRAASGQQQGGWSRRLPRPCRLPSHPRQNFATLVRSAVPSPKQGSGAWFDPREEPGSSRGESGRRWRHRTSLPRAARRGERSSPPTVFVLGPGRLHRPMGVILGEGELTQAR